VLDLAVESPTYEVRGMSPVPYIDAAATMDNNGAVSVFILNRDLDRARDLELVWRDAPPQRVQFSQVLTGADLKAFNSFENPKRVAPQAFDAGKTGMGRTTLRVPPRSYTVIQWNSPA
jgi:alpha-N-arabinofuranosidase